MFQKRIMTKFKNKNQNNQVSNKPEITPMSYSKLLDMTI